MTVLEQIKGGLVVSCQAEGNSPFNNPDDVAKFAITAQMGGAVAIRTEGVEKTKAILKQVNLPVISLVKSEFENGFVRITGRFSDVEDLKATGCHMIAIDGTFRQREGLTGPEFIQKVKEKYNVLIMADIATVEEAEACIKAGADCISTTLAGYTPETQGQAGDKPNYGLLEKLTGMFGNRVPVIAEGRFNSPGAAKKAIELGAWAVVVGSAITRPHLITKWFSDAIKR